MLWQIIAVTSVASLHALGRYSPNPLRSILNCWSGKLQEYRGNIQSLDVAITGIKYLDTSNRFVDFRLQTGDKFTHPGSDIFAKAIANVWRQKLFSEVQVFVTAVQDDRVSIRDLMCVERTRLSNFKFNEV